MRWLSKLPSLKARESNMAVKSYIDAVREAMDLALEKDNNV